LLYNFSQHTQQKRFNLLYHSHLKAPKRQGKAKATIDAYARAVRRIAEYFDAARTS